MSSRPLALWHLKVPSGGAKAPGYDDEEDYPLPYRITMAAIDSSISSTKPSTLKLHRKVMAIVADDEDDKDEEEETREEETIICTLESGKVCKISSDGGCLIVDVPTALRYHHSRR